MDSIKHDLTEKGFSDEKLQDRAGPLGGYIGHSASQKNVGIMLMKKYFISRSQCLLLNYSLSHVLTCYV